MAFDTWARDEREERFTSEIRYIWEKSERVRNLRHTHEIVDVHKESSSLVMLSLMQRDDDDDRRAEKVAKMKQGDLGEKSDTCHHEIYFNPYPRNEI